MGLGAGQIVLDTDLSGLIAKTYQRPIGRLIQQVAQSMPTPTQTGFTFAGGSEDIDTHNAHSTAVNTSRVIPTIPGYYRFRGVGFFTTAVATHQLVFRKNGATSLAPAWRGPGFSGTWSTAMIEVTQPMNGTTDYMELTCIMGSAVLSVVSVQFSSTLEWEFVRDL